jgi:hypothetical protein
MLAVAFVLIAPSGCDVYDGRLLASSAPSGSPRCGNASVDEGELCDTGIDPAEPGGCPAACSRANPCEPQVRVGTGCQVECLSVAITKASNGDGCCPPEIGAGEDSDCGFCGDGIIGPSETCDPRENCSTEDECTQRNTCLVSVFSGDPDSCTARCQWVQIAACGDDDQCCPDACDASTDNDCSASCGDGVVQVEGGETCEPEDAQAPCVDTCDDADACTSDLMTGSANNCNAQCNNEDIVLPIAGDGCCPPGAHALNDDDCAPFCGNAVREPPETCDPCPGNCDDADTCTIDAESGDADSCSLVCTHTPRSAQAAADGCCPIGANANNDGDCTAACGNAVTEASEDCDGGNLCTPQCELNDQGRCQDVDSTSAPSACQECRCRECTQLMLGCFTNSDPTFASNCRDTVECGQTNHCTGDACYCGTNATCTAPNGPCRNVIDAAAAEEGENAQSCTDDPGCSVHQATAIGACVEDHCASECEH